MTTVSSVALAAACTASSPTVAEAPAPNADNNIDNEVDRYINWPGRALAYKVGQLKIRAPRERAEKRQHAAFRLPAFHDVVLSAGAVTLPVLEGRVDAWLEGSEGP